MTTPVLASAAVPAKLSPRLASRAPIAQAFVLAAVLFVGRAAWGADPAEVEALIEEANDLRRQGKDYKALPLMQKAYELARTARTAAQLGLVEIALGYWLEAETHLAEALASPRDPWIHKNRAELERALNGARGSIGELDIHGQPSGAEVFVNGQLVGLLPLPKPVRVGDGPVRIEVRAANFKTAVRSLTMARGKSHQFEFQLQPLQPSPSKLEVPESARTVGVVHPQPKGFHEYARPLGWTASAASAAAIGLGVAESFWWVKKRDAFNNHTRLVSDTGGTMTSVGIRDCGDRVADRGGEECRKLYDDMNRAKTMAIVGYVTGGLMAVGASVLFFASPARNGRPTDVSLASCGPLLTTIGGTCGVRF
jgi:PEGA domain